MKALEVEGLDPSRPLRPNAVRIVRARLEELHGFSDEALAAGAGTAQHEMRIAAKRLRYLLEVIGPCLGEEAETARAAATELQSVLGDLHDCELMLARVAGIDSLVTLLRTRRELLYRRFVELWGEEEGKGTWAALERKL
jgi:CHAD domain-containing protein